MDWTEVLNQLIDILLPVLATALTAVFSYLGVKIKAILQEKADTETKQKIIESTVRYVEQICKDVNSEEKLNKAIETASVWLTEKGITVSETELRVLIEAAVNGLKQGTAETKQIEE